MLKGIDDVDKYEFLSLIYDADIGKEMFEIIRRAGKPTSSVTPAGTPAPKAEFFSHLKDAEVCKELFGLVKRGGKPPTPASMITSSNVAANAAALRESIRNRITQTEEEPKPSAEFIEKRKSTLKERLQFMKEQSQKMNDDADGTADGDSTPPDGKYTLVVEKDCPICGEKTKVTTSKTRLIAEVSDLDFCMHFKNFNPYLYSIYVCENCGYAASEVRFQERYSQRVKKEIKAFLDANKFKTPFVEERDKEEALTLYEMAIYFNEMFERSPGRQAILYQKMAWICRIENDTEKEKEYLLKCAELFEESITSERYPIDKVSDNRATYIIGANYFMLEEYDKAVKYLGNIISSSSVRKSSPKIYEKARDIWQEIRAIKNGSKAI